MASPTDSDAATAGYSDAPPSPGRFDDMASVINFKWTKLPEKSG